MRCSSAIQIPAKRKSATTCRAISVCAPGYVQIVEAVKQRGGTAAEMTTNHARRDERAQQGSAAPRGRARALRRRPGAAADASRLHPSQPVRACPHISVRARYRSRLQGPVRAESSRLTMSSSLSRPFKPGRYAAGLRVPIPEYAGAIGKVRYVGEPVAIVAADTRAAAEDALELIEVEYEPLPAVGSPEAAVAADAPLIYEELGSNVAWQGQVSYGDVDARISARRSHRPGESEDPPLQLDAARAVCLPRGTHAGAADDLVQLAVAGRHLRRDHRGAGHRQRTRHRPGYRRRLRPEDSSDSQVRRPYRADGGENRPAREVDRGPKRAHDGRRPLVRAGVRRRSRGEVGRRSPGAEDRRHRRRGRVDQHVDDSFHEQAQQPVQHLQGPAPAAGRAVGADQQVSGRSQPGHRQTRDVLCLGADDGPHRPGAGARCDRRPPPQPDHQGSVSVHDAKRQHSRQRRLPDASR